MKREPGRVERLDVRDDASVRRSSARRRVADDTDNASRSATLDHASSHFAGIHDVAEDGGVSSVRPARDGSPVTGPSQPLLLVDTNVWVNNYIDRGPSHDSAKQFVVSALQHDAVLCTSAGTLKDVYFAISAELKKLQRASGGAVDASFAAAIDEVAWSCIVNLMDISTIVPIGSGDALMATTFRSAHRDFEDDILLAIARRICAACIVTDDCGLLAHFPQLCISPQHALELLEE